jgi:hypothetical protein
LFVSRFRLVITTTNGNRPRWTPPLNLTGISPEIDRYRPNLTDTAAKPDRRPSPARRRWTGTALAATGVLTVIGLVTAFGVLGRVIIF